MPHKTKTHPIIATTLALLLILLTLLTACGSSPEKPLEREDYNIYLNGEKAIDIDEIELFTISEDTEEAYETMRGIKLGATPQDVARAYKNNTAFTFSHDSEEDIIVPDLGQFLKEHPDFKNGFSTFTVAVIDGVLEQNRDAIDMAKEKHPQHEIKMYSLLFSYQDGKVRQIQCWTGMYEGPSQNTDST